MTLFYHHKIVPQHLHQFQVHILVIVCSPENVGAARKGGILVSVSQGTEDVEKVRQVILDIVRTFDGGGKRNSHG